MAPWAARNFAATLNARGNGSISSVWDWAAQYLILKASTLPDGYFGAEHLGAPILPAQSARETLSTPSKTSSPKPDASSSAPEEIVNRRRRPPTQLGSQGNTSVPTPPPTQPSPSQPRGGHREESSQKSPKGTHGPDAHLHVPTFTTSYRPNSPTRTPRATPSEEDARERASGLRSEQRHPSSSFCQGRAPSKHNPKFCPG